MKFRLTYFWTSGPVTHNILRCIAITFSEDPDLRLVARRAWQQRVKESFDFAALAALLK